MIPYEDLVAFPIRTRLCLRYITCDTVRAYKRFLWVVCASISMLSARHILVEQNIHYPLQLYFNQLAVIGLMALRSCFGWRDIRNLSRENPQPWRLMTRGTVLLTASMCFTSLSTICTLQAILHFHNLPTVVMMIVRRIRVYRILS